jgi:hypothetical protein
MIEMSCFIGYFLASGTIPQIPHDLLVRRVLSGERNDSTTAALLAICQPFQPPADDEEIKQALCL